jgi:transcription elongation factor Elf1
MDTPSLLPCPFCGSPARLGCTPHAGEEKARILIQCRNVDCGATIEGRAGEAAIVVVAKWNRRTETKGNRTMKETPKLDDLYSCKECGMRLRVEIACSGDDPKKITLKCCGKQLTRTPGDADAAATAAPLERKP